MQLRVENFNLGVTFNVTGSNFAFPGCINVDRLRSIAIDLDDNALEV